MICIRVWFFIPPAIILIVVNTAILIEGKPGRSLKTLNIVRPFLDFLAVKMSLNCDLTQALLPHI